MNFEVEIGETPLSNIVTNLSVNPPTPGPTGPAGLPGGTGPTGPSYPWENVEITFTGVATAKGTCKKVGPKVFWNFSMLLNPVSATEFLYISDCPPQILPASGSITTMPMFLVDGYTGTGYVLDGRLDSSGLAIVNYTGEFIGAPGLNINFTYNLSD